jgi:hypothetical protein
MTESMQNLIFEVELLEKTAKEDFSNKFWNSYLNHLREYNSLLSRAHSLGHCADLHPLSDVAPGEKSAFGMIGTQPQQAKLRQIGTEASKLLGRLRSIGTQKTTILSPDPVLLAELICNRFYIVAKQLEVRHASRSTLIITDEYDVQDLLHSLLKLHFDDVRPEEWTPSYAGSSSRIDFLLKKERIVIEVKKTRNSLAAKEVGDQLLIDIARYAKSPDCDTLICFVYDPDGIISNPRGLESDLVKQSSNALSVRVLVRPSK